MTFASNLYGRAEDEEDYGYYTMWYQVILEEDVKHFFLSGWFPPMKATVQSVAKITHYIEGSDLFNQTFDFAEKQTYASWDHIKMEKESNSDADNRSVLSNGNKYREGDKHRFEILRLGGYGGTGGGTKNPYTSRGNVDQRGYDDLFIDWRPDMKGMKTEDLDIGIKDGVSGHNSWTHFYSDNSKLTGADNLIRRIHGVINFEPLDGKFPYPVRDADFYRKNNAALKALRDAAKVDGHPYVDENGKDLSDADLINKVAKEPPDVLYARIESEPVHDGKGLQSNGDNTYTRIVGDQASSIHQIIINLNVANTAKYTLDKYAGEYSDRPVFFYYTGPEKIDPNSHVRDSLPVVINFNADYFRGIFFFPNSPVVINGNQNNFEGYVIAKEFVMLKTYENETYSDGKVRGGDFLHFASFNSATDVYYDRSLLVEGTVSASQSPHLQKITIDGQTKYVLQSDLAKYINITDATLDRIGNTWYNKDDLKTAEQLALESGNGKIHYYYTCSQTANNKWTPEQIIEETNKLEWILPEGQGEVWFDRTKSDSLSTFANGWKYNNNGTPNGQGVWRVKEILPDGTEDTLWLDEKDATKNKFLLKVAGDPGKTIPANVYNTPEELLMAMGGYTQVDSTRWRRTEKLEYMQVTIDGETHYLPKSITLFDGDMKVPESMENIIPVKYYEAFAEKTGCADISGNPEKYYKVYQDNYDGTPSNDNPMFVDELGNVQYRHKKNANGTEIATNSDGSVAYETIKPTVDPHTDPALLNRAIEEADKMLAAHDIDEDQYEATIQDLFKEKFPYLDEEDDYHGTSKIMFFNKNDFNLKTSVFDSFQLVKMTEYSYLNMKDDKRSINNLFTNADALRTD